MKTSDFSTIREKLISSKPDNCHLSHILKIITEQDVENLMAFISKRKHLIDYNTVDASSSHAISVFFNRILPIMYEDEEIEEYFLDILIQMHDDEDNWTYTKKRDLFKQITGITFDNFETRNLYLGIVFNRVHDEQFLPKYLYPQSFINHGLDLISRKEPLAENYAIFQQKYQRYEGNSYIKFMYQYYMNNIGAEAFAEYLDAVVAKFDASLEIHDRNTYTNDRFLDFIFGFHWNFFMHINDAIRKNSTDRIIIEKMILRAVFPYTIVNYPAKHQRQSVYDILELNEDEISELERKSNLSDRQAYIPKAVATDYSEDGVMRFGSTYREVFDLIDKAIAELTANKRIILSKTKIIDKCRELSSGALFSDFMYARRTSSLWVQLAAYIDEKISKTNDAFFKTNKQEFRRDTWVIFYRMNDHYRSITMSFSGLNASPLKTALKEYCRHTIIENNYRYSPMKTLRELIDTITYLADTFSVVSASDVTEYQVLSVLRYYETEKGHKPCTIMERLTGLKGFFKYYATTHKVSDPTLNIKLNNLKEHRGSTDVIPDDILVYIDNHLKDIKQVDCMLAYRVLIETGWRFSDIRKIKPDDVKLSDDGTYGIITTISPKTRKARTKRLLGAEIEDVISLPLYEDIQKFLSDTANIREIYSIETLFYSIIKGRVSTFRTDSLNRALNNMLIHAGIRSINESYLRFSAMQTRKTVASILVSAGAPIASVQKKLGHVSPQTAERYYAEVNKKKLAELNDEFYKQKFDVYMSPEKLKLFTEDERRLLYVDFCMNHRTVELGVCSKHPSEGRCATLGHTSCASCPKLCTGKKWLSRWETLANDSAQLLQMFKDKYEAIGIPKEEYSSYIEYRQEYDAYQHYLSVIQMIKNGG